MAPLLDLRNHRRSYRHLRNLIAVLGTVFPAATEDPNFLDRSLLMEGVSLRATPFDLLDEALGVQVDAAVVVRDAEFGDSVGLLVLTHARDTEVAMEAGPRPGVLCDCIKATDSGYTRIQILEALDDRVRRQATAELFRSLVPPEYLLADADMTFHLSCVFLRGPGCSRLGDGGLYNLCNIGANELLANGPVNAVILGPDHDVAVLVYYDAQGTERVGRRELYLRQKLLGMYDSSLFPLPAGADAEEASLMRRLLPPFVTPADYLGRVILLTGIKTKTCDAADIARFIATAGLGNALEAVIVHRSGGAVFVVLQRQSQSEMLLQEPQEDWLAAFKSPVECQLLGATPMQQQQQLAPPPLQLDLSRLSLGPRQWVNPRAFEIVRLEIGIALARCPDHDFVGLNLLLIELAALSDPHTLRSSYFPERAVLLTRTRSGMEQWELRTALARYGALDELVYVKPRRIALVVFTSWTGATRVLREPAATWMHLGFVECRPADAADAGFLSYIVNRVLQRLLFLHGMLPPSI